MEFASRYCVCGAAFLAACALICCSSGDASSCGTDADACQIESVTAFTHKMVQRLSGHRAVDLVLVVSAIYTLEDYHSWIQPALQQMDAKLRSLNIGTEASIPNRYAVVQFGGRGFYKRAAFIRLAEGIFFTMPSFPLAARQLQRVGAIADGYYALDFAAKYAPFRNDSDVAKMILLIANTERNTLETKSTLTTTQVSDMLSSKNIMLDAVVDTKLKVTTSAGNVPVFGLNGPNRGITVGRNGTYQTHDGTSTSANPTKIYNDYVTLVLDLGGVVCSLEQLVSSNATTFASFLGAMVFEHSLQGIEPVEVCEECHCGGGGASGTCGRVICEAPTNQSLCSCLVKQSPSVCDGSEVLPVATTATPTTTPITIIAITGTVSVFPGGDVEVTFTSTKRRATYECLLLDSSTLAPAITPCSSPWYVKNVISGRHKILVMAKRKNAYGTRVFDFSIGTTETEEDRLMLSLNQKSNATNGTVAVTMTVGNAAIRGGSSVNLVCSVAGRPFLPCSSPHYVTAGEIPAGPGGVMFIASALSSDRRPAIAVTTLLKPVLPTGPVKIQLLRAEPPDPLGRITIRFNTSRMDVRCICRVNITHLSCPNQYVADPRVLGAGPHNLTIICMDYSGFVDTQHFKLFLPPPSQPQVFGPIGCNLTLQNPTDSGMITASFSCDRRVYATCQVSGQAADPCNYPFGVYEIDVRQLSRGPHLFILSVDDGFGRTLMKVYPFSLGMAHRMCCPRLDEDLSSLTLLDNITNVLLDLRVSAGNCSENEGFSYAIDWGDGAMQTGSTIRAGSITASNYYPNSRSRTSSSSSGTTHRQVKVSYCNNPVSLANKCCDKLSFPVGK